ncbi:MAG: MFS transporter [Candidatus Brockarchaeota archaeon]|nr:MFS transporter [Candidatus Brockarchaeota archaeon]
MSEGGRVGLRKSVYEAVLLFGIVSLMGDVIYEGARGLIPGYLQSLGASALIVGLVGGLGEFLGYFLRILSGHLADKTGWYWVFTFIGYGLIIVVPLLSLSSIWTVAIVLVILERIGKGIRTPARDTLLSIIGKGSATGRVFGLHEFFDQIGAIVGPFMVSLAMFYTLNNYQLSFSLMFAPYVVLMLVLFHTFVKIGKTINIERAPRKNMKKTIDPGFKFYIVAVFFNTLGLIPVALIQYKASVLLSPQAQQWIVPLLYLTVQAVDAPIAILAGYLYDKHGLKILVLPFLLSVVPSILTPFSPDLLLLVIASIFFGVVLGMQESVYRAAVSDLVSVEKRGTAYGVFNTAYGLGLFLGGLIYGFFTDVGIAIILIGAYSIIMQVVSVIFLSRIIKKK